MSAVILRVGGTYQVRQQDTSIYVKTRAPVRLQLPPFPLDEQEFRVSDNADNPQLVIDARPNSIANYGPVYTFGGGIASLLVSWDGEEWNLS